MKSMNPALRALLATREYVVAECWTITLNGGTFVRWTGADVSVTASGNSFAKGPLLKRGAISSKRGVDTATLELEITALSTDLISGIPIIPFIASHGLDGASLRLESAFAPDWETMRESGATGTVLRFAGKITSIKSIQGDTATVTISSWLWLLQNYTPRELYQPGCLNSLYDSSCALNPASFSATGTTTAAGQTTTLATSLSATAGTFALGYIIFSSGPNAGVRRTVKSSDGSGNITLVPALPSPCGSGDAFTIFQGCDLTKSTCQVKFNNLVNFRATPFVPQPTTPLGSAAAPQKTSSGK